jgi:hypothetical protein
VVAVFARLCSDILESRGTRETTACVFVDSLQTSQVSGGQAMIGLAANVVALSFG